jgi:hypothetical protein
MYRVDAGPGTPYSGFFVSYLSAAAPLSAPTKMRHNLNDIILIFIDLTTKNTTDTPTEHVQSLVVRKLQASAAVPTSKAHS